MEKPITAVKSEMIDLGTDHFPVIATVRTKLNKVTTTYTSMQNKAIQWLKCTDEQRDTYNTHVNTKL